MFKKNIKRILKKCKRKRIKELSNNLDNIVFLDFDGVINLDSDNYTGPFNNKDLIKNLNNFCLDNNFKIVVISSWRKYSNYKDILYKSGLNKKIEIVGSTNNLDKDRESEIIKYLEDHCYIGKFIILDDKPFNLLRKFQILTDYDYGFNKEKFNEACELIKNKLWE